MTQTTPTDKAQITAAPDTTGLSHDAIRTFVPEPECLKGKYILVTGAGDGIGREAALTYAKYGATLLLLGKTTAKLEAVYDDIEAAGGAQPAIIPMNLEGATHADIQSLVPLIQNEFGRLDGLLLNAAVLGTMTPLSMYDIDTFTSVMKVNFQSSFQLTQVLLPLLEASKHGSVVYTTSSVGSQPRAFWGAYALSKQGVEGLCEIFTQETQNISNLRFNCINPGGTRTNMRAHAYPGENPASVPLPSDIMAGYVCLMADASKAVRGQVIDLQPK